VEKRRGTAPDVLVGLAIPGLIVLVVVFSVRAAPTSSHEAF